MRFAAARACSPRTARWSSRPASTPAAAPRTSSSSRDATTDDTVWWGKSNKPMDPAHCANLKADFLAALGGQGDAVRPGPVRRVAARASRPRARHQRICLAQPVHPHDAGAARSGRAGRLRRPNITIIDLPSFRADPERHGCRSETVIAVNLTEKMILIGGTEYGGEMKKSVFGLLNFLLPPQRHHADALLGQYRPQGRHRDLLRPVAAPARRPCRPTRTAR